MPSLPTIMEIPSDHRRVLVNSRRFINAQGYAITRGDGRAHTNEYESAMPYLSNQQVYRRR